MENSTCSALSPATTLFNFIFFAIILVYYDSLFYWKTAHVQLYHQQLHGSTSFLLQSYLFVTIAPYHQKSCGLVQWVADPAYGCLISGLHATASLAYAPSLATFNLTCYGHHLEPSLTVANDGTNFLGTLKKKHPHFGGQSPPLWFFTECSLDINLQYQAEATIKIM